ncbi:MAG: precorrin-6A/cobalt-precorrin-6A reductase [Cyanobacteria bacterium J06650_10]
MRVRHMRCCIWLIGGTSESAQLARALSKQELPYVVTVTTAAAKRLYPDDAQVWVGLLNAQSAVQFIAQWQVRCILDASHPFACEISQLAMNCAESQSIDYLRYERPAVKSAVNSVVHPAVNPSVNDSKDIEDTEADSGGASAISPQGFQGITELQDKGTVISVNSIPDLLESDILRGQRVLFTVGYRYLSHFSSLRPDSQLFARILPSVAAISGAIAAGFSPAEIIALKPPVSAAVECALWQQWNITQVVAKASGKPSGESTKRAVAADLGIPLILIKRPQMMYLNQTDCVLDAIEFCRKVLRVYYPNA